VQISTHRHSLTTLYGCRTLADKRLRTVSQCLHCNKLVFSQDDELATQIILSQNGLVRVFVNVANSWSRKTIFNIVNVVYKIGASIVIVFYQDMKNPGFIEKISGSDNQILLTSFHMEKVYA
jgi:hypothetical protein